MLMEMVKGRTASDVAALPKEELLEEIGIPLTPIRLKCALLGLGVLKVALHRAKGTPLPAEWAGLATSSSSSSVARSTSARSTSCRRAQVKIVTRARSRSASTTWTASCTRSRTAARTTTGRSARATSTLEEGFAVCPRHGVAASTSAPAAP